MHHAYVIEADADAGIETAKAWAKKELGMDAEQNPDIAVLRYGLFSVEEARNIAEAVSGAPFKGAHKVVIITANRAYHEAQNALLKIFEEPPAGTYLFLVLPTLGGLLPTLRSRVQTLSSKGGHSTSTFGAEATAFLKATKEKRTALIKRLASGRDEEEKREHREEAIALVNDIEAAAYAAYKKNPSASLHALLSDIETLRGFLYERSAPTRMVLEHLSLVIPSELVY